MQLLGLANPVLQFKAVRRQFTDKLRLHQVRPAGIFQPPDSVNVPGPQDEILAVFKVQTVLYHTAEIRDRLIILGGENGSCRHTLRLIEVRFGSTWYRYLIGVLDPNILPASVVAKTGIIAAHRRRR